jgi:hypothetical protein
VLPFLGWVYSRSFTILHTHLSGLPEVMQALAMTVGHLAQLRTSLEETEQAMGVLEELCDSAHHHVVEVGFIHHNPMLYSFM